MLFPFLLLSIITTAAICGTSSIMWPDYLWAVPLMIIAFFVAWFLLYVLFLLIVSLCTDTKKEYDSRSKFYRGNIIIMVGIILSFFRVKVKVKGAGLIPADTRWLLVGNHRSMFDPIATLWALRKHELSFVAKPSIFKIPIAKPFITREFFLSIDRENNREALKTILQAADYLKRGVCSVGIYPEGTRSKTCALLPFHNGVFKIAQKAEAPIVVLCITGTEKISQRTPFQRTDVYLDVLDAFPTQGVKETKTEMIGTAVRHLIATNTERRDAIWTKDM